MLRRGGQLDKLSRDFHEQVVALLQTLDIKMSGGPVYEEPFTPGTPSGDRAEGSCDDSGDLDALRFLTFQLETSSTVRCSRQTEGNCSLVGTPFPSFLKPILQVN